MTPAHRRSPRKMTFYDGIYPFYPLQRTPFIFSPSLLTIILVFLVLAASLLLILPGIRGKSRFFWMFRIIISLFIGVVIVALNFTADWAQGSLSANSTYKSFSSAVVSADLGLHVGLYGINITLRGNPVHQLNETIDYNEEFRWGGGLDEQYSEALQRGLPSPILYIAEKFTRTSPCGLIFQYRYSGRYASATLWTAFCCWLLANILFSLPVIQYGGFMMLATAAFLFLSMASFSSIFGLPQCSFSLGDASLRTSYSTSFWLALATGVLCVVIGCVVVLLDWLVPERVREAFSISGDDDEQEQDLPHGYLNANFLEGVAIEGGLAIGGGTSKQAGVVTGGGGVMVKGGGVNPATILQLAERL